jgi:hypothetical protein
LFQKEPFSTAFIFHIIESGLNKAWMSDKSLHASLELALVPRLSLFRRCLSGQDGSFYAGGVQN